MASFRITAAQPLVPGPEGGQLEPTPLLTPAEAQAEAAAFGPAAFNLEAIGDLPPEWLSAPVERALAAGELAAYTHVLHVVDPPALHMPPAPLVCRDYLVRVEP